MKFHLFFRRHGNWLNKVRYPSCLFLLTFKLFLCSFFSANPEIPPLHSFLCSVAIDEQTWNIRQLGRHLSAPSWHTTYSLPFTSLSCNQWKVSGRIEMSVTAWELYKFQYSTPVALRVPDKTYGKLNIFKFRVCQSVLHHYTIQLNQPTRCSNFSGLLLVV